MKKLYLIIHDAKLDRNAILDFLGNQKGFGMWFYSMPSSFFVYSAFESRKIAEMIQLQFGSDKRVFVTEVSNLNSYGYMPKDHWNIVNNRGAEKVFVINFNGYYVDTHVFPHSSGLYCVYRCNHNVQTKTVVLNQLLYIGQAEDLYVHHLDYNKKDAWLKKLKYGEVLCYTYATIPKSDLDRSEAALIYINQPVCNDQLREYFSYFDTRIIVTGMNALLSSDDIAEQSK